MAGLAPLLTENDLGERYAAAAPRWTGELPRSCRVAEVQDVLAVAIRWVGQDLAAQLVVVDRGGNGAEFARPRHEDHVLRCAPQVPHH